MAQQQKPLAMLGAMAADPKKPIDVRLAALKSMAWILAREARAQAEAA